MWESSLRADWEDGQAQYDLFVRLAQPTLKDLPLYTIEVTEQTRATPSRHRELCEQPMRGACVCERSIELPQNSERKRLGTTRMTEKRAGIMQPQY